MEYLSELVRDWSAGVITTVRSDNIPPNSSPRGKNAYLAFAAGDKAIVRKRRGGTLMNGTAITGGGEIFGQAYYKLLSGGTFTNYHVAASATGRLDLVASDGTYTNLSTALVASSTAYPDFATANNLLFIVNGTDRLKYNGTSVQNFGIAEPSTAPTLADSGAGGSPDGTYEGRVTFYNSATGVESSAGPTSGTVTVVTNTIDWTSIPVSADTQVTSRRLYVRNTGTMTTFRLLTTIADNVTTTYTQTAADTILLTAGPDTEENDRPPSGIKYIEWHLSRMFAADDTTLYYSKSTLPENFDPDFTEPVNQNDGQKITGLHAFGDILIIFKTDSFYGLYGDDPNSWVVRPISTTVGCVSNRSIRAIDGVLYWWSERGPVAWDGSSNPRLIGQDSIAQSIDATAINYAEFARVVAEVDVPQTTLLWSVPVVSQTRNTVLFPWNYRLGRWMGEWDPFDVASMTVTEDADTGQPSVMMGSYSGRLWKWWDADADGVPSGTTTGSFTATGTTQTVLTDLTAAFYTTGSGLKDCKVTVLNSSGAVVGSNRQRIDSNTATALTLVTATSGLTSGDTYTYIVGGPDFQWDTPWLCFGDPFSKKRFLFLYFLMESAGSAVNIKADLSFNEDSTVARTKSFTFSNSSSGVWDTSLWDAVEWGGLAASASRLRIGRTGRSWRVRLRNHYANQTVGLLSLGIKAVSLWADRFV